MSSLDGKLCEDGGVGVFSGESESLRKPDLVGGTLQTLSTRLSNAHTGSSSQPSVCIF